jgi:hypothetical protein
VTPAGVWLVLPDQLSTRLFFDAGIVERLQDRLGERLSLVFLLSEEEAKAWEARADGLHVLDARGLQRETGVTGRLLRRLDAALDKQLGYYPLAIRLNYRHGFHLERMAPGHANWMLDSSRVGRLPRRRRVERWMQRWFFSPRRHVPGELADRMHRECGTLVLTNV